MRRFIVSLGEWAEDTEWLIVSAATESDALEIAREWAELNDYDYTPQIEESFDEFTTVVHVNRIR